MMIRTSRGRTGRYRIVERTRVMVAFLRFFLLFVLGISAVWAQVSTGSIVGVVEDSSGAVIPNAEITTRQTATGETRLTRTNGSGEFNVPFIQPVDYKVTAAAGGFKGKTVSGLTLRIHHTANLRITLDLFAPTQTAVL